MDQNLERQIRQQAEHWRVHGVLFWDRELRSSSLDPSTWSKDSAWPPVRQQGDGFGVRHAATRMMHRSAPMSPKTYDAATNSIELTWTTGAAVLRNNTWDGTYSEVLEVTTQACRLGRLNLGAPFLNSHMVGSLDMQLGAVMLGSARIVNGKGLARIALSDDPAKAGIVGDIKAGKIRNVSVGYRIFAWVIDDKPGSEIPVVMVTDWEPTEISAVTIPADPQAQIN